MKHLKWKTHTHKTKILRKIKKIINDKKKTNYTIFNIINSY